MEEEFELVPMNPIRRLEKKIKELESNSSGDMLKDLVEVVKTNQKIVDDLVRINSSAIKEMSETNINLKMLVERLDSFLDRIDASISSESGQEVMEKLNQIAEQTKTVNESYQQLSEKLEKLERRVNAMLLTRLKGVRGVKR